MKCSQEATLEALCSSGVHLSDASGVCLVPGLRVRPTASQVRNGLVESSPGMRRRARGLRSSAILMRRVSLQAGLVN